MKKLILIFASHILSINAFATSLSAISRLPYDGAVTTVKVTTLYFSGKLDKNEALMIINDSQEYEAGKVSVFLEQKIKVVQEINPNLSESEAVGVLLEVAMTVLN